MTVDGSIGWNHLARVPFKNVLRYPERPTMLDNRPVRNDLTSRECANLLGAFLGGLAEMAPLEAIREAVKYYAEHDDPWAMLEAVNEALKSNIAAAKGAVCICGHGAQAHANSATECNGCMCPEFKLDYLSVLP